MPTDVVMPQMGESIFEGTITKWLKKPGERVQRDEPLFEISTDKVDAEIPSPASGVLKEIKVGEGNTVQVNTVVGVIDEAGSAQAAPQPAKAAGSTKGGATTDGPTQAQPPKPAPMADGTPGGQSPATEQTVAQQTGGDGGAGTDVVMPQMGESVFEGTITKWLKKVGDRIERDQPLFEISTDKVDAEIPAPASGILREIRAKEGETVQVNAVVAVIGGAGGAAAAAPAKPAPAAAPQPQPSAPAPRETVAPTRAEGERIMSSPLVRKMAEEHKVDLAQVSGSGMGGRITKEDIEKFIAQHPGGAPARPAAAAHPSIAPGEVVPMTQMRKIIAQRMVESKRTSAHVHSVFKVDMTRVVKMREREGKKWQSVHGAKLTFMPFVMRAVVNGLTLHPLLNSSVEGESIRYHKQINIGIAVALDWGLIVPVVKDAGSLSFAALQKSVSDLGERARSKRLKPEEVQGGTFTITNPGIFGPQFGMPIIMQPQVAILGMGGIFKEPVVRTDEEGQDAIVVRSIIRFSIGYDHRIVDGADADRFMVAVRDFLQDWNEDIY